MPPDYSLSYPTIEQVLVASPFQLARWVRFLPSPGYNSIDNDDYGEIAATERFVLDLILAQFSNCGGWTPTLSKAVGW